VSEKRAEERILPSRIFIELGDMSSKQRKIVLGLIKDLGFVPEEIGELVVLVQRPEDSAGEGERGEPTAGGEDAGSG
jgi:hypothetical protein